jgi:hypothetical protein
MDYSLGESGYEAKWLIVPMPMQECFFEKNYLKN